MNKLFHKCEHFNRSVYIQQFKTREEAPLSLLWNCTVILSTQLSMRHFGYSCLQDVHTQYRCDTKRSHIYCIQTRLTHTYMYTPSHTNKTAMKQGIYCHPMSFASSWLHNQVSILCKNTIHTFFLYWEVSTFLYHSEQQAECKNILHPLSIAHITPSSLKLNNLARTFCAFFTLQALKRQTHVM